MDVIVRDSKYKKRNFNSRSARLEQRPVARVERLPVILAGQSAARHFVIAYFPELKDDEICEWLIGSDVPRIVKIRPLAMYSQPYHLEDKSAQEA